MFVSDDFNYILQSSSHFLNVINLILLVLKIAHCVEVNAALKRSYVCFPFFNWYALSALTFLSGLVSIWQKKTGCIYYPCPTTLLHPNQKSTDSVKIRETRKQNIFYKMIVLWLLFLRSLLRKFPQQHACTPPFRPVAAVRTETVAFPYRTPPH